ncbi:MAG: hypothetical protein ACR2QC_11950 [Gammaproteobacteria bacterium]
MRRLLIAVVFICLASPHAFAVIAFDAASSDFDGSAVTSLTYSHTTTGTDRALIVGVGGYISGATFPDVPTVTYDAVSMTQEATLTWDADGFATRLTLFCLANPSTGASDVVVSSTSSNSLFSVAMSYTGANQTDPCGASGTNSVDAGTSTSIDVTTSLGDWAVDVIHYFHDGTTTLTPGAGQTERIHLNNGGSDDSQKGSDEVGAAGTTTMSWTASAAIDIGHIAVQLFEAGAAPAARRVIMVQ